MNSNVIDYSYTNNMSYKPVTDPTIVRVKGTLKTQKRKAEIKDLITSELKGITLSRLDPEALKFAANKIEQLVSKTSGIQKLELLYEIWAVLFPDLNESDKKLIKETIEFLIRNKDIRKKPLRLFLAGVGGCVAHFLSSK